MQSRGRKARCEAELAHEVVSLSLEEKERVNRMGWMGGFVGREEWDCPYREETEFAREWMRGWLRGRWRQEGHDGAPTKGWWPGPRGG